MSKLTTLQQRFTEQELRMTLQEIRKVYGDAFEAGQRILNGGKA